MNKIIASVLAISLIVLVGCTTSGSGSSVIDVCSVESVIQATQTAVVSATTLFKTAYNANTGTITKDQYNKAEGAYTAWANAQPQLASVLSTINDAGGSPSALTQAQYVQLSAEVAALAVNVYISVQSVAKTTQPSKQLLAVKATPAACTVTDVQLIKDLTVPTWTSIAPAAGATLSGWTNYTYTIPNGSYYIAPLADSWAVTPIPTTW